MKHLFTPALILTGSAWACAAEAAPQSQTVTPVSWKETSAQDDASGFFEGQKLTGSTRNWYANEHRQHGATFGYNHNGVRDTTERRINWVQANIVKYQSGFSQGAVGFGVEAAVYNAVALDRDRRDLAAPSAVSGEPGRGGRGNNRTLTDSDGDAVGQWSKLGLANVKARFSNTTLTLGRQNFSSPQVDLLGNRPLPSSFEGVVLHSEELNNLTLDFGHFTRESPRTEQSERRFRAEKGDYRAEASGVDTLGITYQPLASLTARIWATQVRDLWNQYYFGATHVVGEDAALKWTTNVNYYRTRESGSARLGDIDNDAWSVALGVSHLAHSLTLSYQEVDGNEYFDYLHETNGIYLTSTAYADYNGPNEKALKLSYVLDMAPYGVPGLKLNAYAARGWGIDGTHYDGNHGVAGLGYDGIQKLDNERHREIGAGIGYVVQSGSLKDANIRATYSIHRGSQNQADGDIDEFRLVTTIPFNIL